jgi:ABC-type nitrate/sulfonate/bicarbonate transport system substrate-binding protein
MTTCCAARHAGKFLRLFTLLAIAAAFTGATSRISAQELTKLRVATAPNDGGAEAYYALDMGFFKKAGLDVQVTTLSNGAIIASGVASGAFDIGSSAISSIASAHERGIPFVIVAPAALWSSDRITTALVIAKNSPIKTAKDLDGKTVAVNALQSVNHVGPQAWMEQNGGDPSTVKFIEIPFPAMPAALESHRIDAAMLTEPALDISVNSGARILAAPYDAISKKFLFLGWISTSKWVEAHPDTARKFAAVIAQTARWANANPSQSARILEKYTRLPVGAAMARVLYPERSNPSDAQPFIDAATRFRVLSKTFPAGEIFARSSQQ